MMIEIRELVLKAQVTKERHLKSDEKPRNSKASEAADIKKYLDKLSER